MMRLLSLLLLLASYPSLAVDKLVILSPHRKSIQQEFIPAFKEFYKKQYKTDVDVEWLDQGGTSDDVRFLRAKFAKNPKGVGVDIFWGGGSATFTELSDAGFLAHYKLPDSVKTEFPSSVAGIPLIDEESTWFGSAMSSFGIFYNKKLLKFDGLPEPKTWTDLTKPVFEGNITLTDPRRSGSANTMNTIIIQSKGWENGWDLLIRMAANARSFTHSSSDPIKSVVSGDAAVALAIDFYALAKVGDLGPENLGFVLPEGQTVLDPDPVAILKGAKNRKVAERFIDYTLSADAQKLLILPKGSEAGPKFATLGRMAVNPKAYEQTKGRWTYDFNPFEQNTFLNLDLKKAMLYQEVFNDLVGALLVDTHHELKKAWRQIIKKDQARNPEILAKLTAMPLTQKEFEALVDKWDDEVFRNKTINNWVSFAKDKYKQF